MPAVTRVLLRVLFVGLIFFSLLYFDLIRTFLNQQDTPHVHAQGCHRFMIESDQVLCESDEKWFQR